MQRRAELAFEEVSPAAAGLQARIDALFATLNARARQVWVQGSLFDARADQHAQAEAAIVAQWREHLGRHAESAAALTRLRPAEPRLVAAWLDRTVR